MKHKGGEDKDEEDRKERKTPVASTKAYLVSFLFFLLAEALSPQTQITANSLNQHDLYLGWTA